MDKHTCSTVSPMFSKIASSNLYPSSFASFFSHFFFAASIGIDTANKQSKIPRHWSKKILTQVHSNLFIVKKGPKFGIHAVYKKNFGTKLTSDSKKKKQFFS